MPMVSRIHRAVQHRSTVPGIEPMTLVSNHQFPRHAHDQFSIGVITFGAQRSWSGVGPVGASAGDVIMANPGEMHDGVPLDNKARQWRMIYIDPALVARELQEETTRPVEIVHPVAQDLLLAQHFARLVATERFDEAGIQVKRWVHSSCPKRAELRGSRRRYATNRGTPEMGS